MLHVTTYEDWSWNRHDMYVCMFVYGVLILLWKSERKVHPNFVLSRLQGQRLDMMGASPQTPTARYARDASKTQDSRLESGRMEELVDRLKWNETKWDEMKWNEMEDQESGGWNKDSGVATYSHKQTNKPLTISAHINVISQALIYIHFLYHGHGHGHGNMLWHFSDCTHCTSVLCTHSSILEWHIDKDRPQRQ